jgi:uncharacterized protein (TIGR04222 family)
MRYRRRLFGPPIAFAAGAIVLAGAFGSGDVARAQTAGERITSFDSAAMIGSDGDVTVTETIVYDFGTAEHHGILRLIPTRFAYDDVKSGYDRLTPLTVVSVSGSPGTPVQVATSTHGSDTELRIGDPNQTITGEHTYTIRYRLRGALNGFADHDELFLNATGNGWNVPIDHATATVTAPGPVRREACFAGPTGSQLRCDSATASGSVATFSQSGLGPNEGLTVVVGFPTGLVPKPTPILDQRWTFQRAFALRPDTIGPTAGGLALVAALFGLIGWRVGRDRQYVGSAVDHAFGNVSGEEEIVPMVGRERVTVEFEPPEKLRPGQVGVLVHERARPLDVTATIVDLAVRDYLRIVELPSTHRFSQPDWDLQKVKDPDGLKDFERTIFNALFNNRDSVHLSELKNHFASTLSTAERQLLDDTVSQGWFRRRPDQTAMRWRVLGVLVTAAGIGLTVLLAATSSYGLLGIPVLVFGILLVAGAGRLPHRTAKGHAVFIHALGFKRFIDESEKERARFAERQNLFSEYLPYAVVFGATAKWAHAFAGLDGQLPATPWYSGPGPFNVIVFDQTMHSFTVTTAGTLSSTPASSGSSGFSGGFSGGGFGGGGGGSW